MTVKLIQGDCLEEMPKIANDGVKVDLVLADLPYGTTQCKWDNIIPFEPMWECLNGLTYDNTPVVLFGSEPFSTKLRSSNLENFKYDWIWNKAKGANIFLTNQQPLKIHEIISVFSRGKHNYYPIKTKRDKLKKSKNYGGRNTVFGNQKKDKEVRIYTHRNPQSIIKFSNANQKDKKHPTQKPVKLLEYLIKTYTNEDDLVLDFTMGSGSTGVACVNTNRNFIGIELDENYYKIAQERINETKKQTKLM